MAGLLINTVPVRTAHRGNHDYGFAGSAATRAYNDTLEHQHLALRRDSPRHRSGKACSTLFSFTKTTRSTTRRCWVSTSWPSPRSSPANATTTRFRWQAGPGRELGARVEFDTDVFDAASIEALIERFQKVLVSMTADPAARLWSLDLLDEGERARLDQVGQSGGVDPAGALGGVDSGGVRRSGGAYSRGGGAELRGSLSMTYRQLDEASNRLAHLLAGQGVGPGECVALLL